VCVFYFIVHNAWLIIFFSSQVMSFIQGFGVTPVFATPSGDYLSVSINVSVAEQMLGCQYLSVQHALTGHIVTRTLSYSLPAAVAAAVDIVVPTVHFPPQKPKIVNAALVNDPAAISNTPKVLRNLYSVGDALGKFPGNKMAVTAFLGQHYSLTDLHEFWASFCDPANLTCGLGDPTLVGDATTGVVSGVESMLDIQTITSVAGNLHAEFWGFSGRDPDNKDNEPFFTWLTQMDNTSDADVPKVFSTSYGEDENSWTLDAGTRLNTEFQKNGVRGISLLFASGDEGANCENGRFQPETPSSSPWVTAVGGTDNNGLSAIGLSSGGFSDRWPQPSYQAAAVAAYLNNTGTLPSPIYGYNVTNRGYPDIASQASDFTVVVNRVPMPGVAGTSCASPTAAAVVALINDARLQAGQPVLGFLNPWLYRNMALFNDIKQGSSGGACAGGKGWPATAGWDAVTGVGSLNYAKLVGSN